MVKIAREYVQDLLPRSLRLRVTSKERASKAFHQGLGRRSGGSRDLSRHAARYSVALPGPAPGDHPARSGGSLSLWSATYNLKGPTLFGLQKGGGSSSFVAKNSCLKVMSSLLSEASSALGPSRCYWSLRGLAEGASRCRWVWSIVIS